MSLTVALDPARSLTDSAALNRGAYRATYRLRGPLGSSWIQQVLTTIRWWRGEHEVVTYTSAYAEFFRFLAGTVHWDQHDFELGRDGWGAGALQRLLRRNRLSEPLGEGRLEVHKEFVCGPGELQGVAPGTDFGYLRTLAGEAPRTRLSCLGEDVSTRPPPFPRPVQGEGLRSRGPSWSAAEHYEFRPALLSGRLQRRGYTRRE